MEAKVKPKLPSMRAFQTWNIVKHTAHEDKKNSHRGHILYYDVISIAAMMRLIVAHERRNV